MLGWGDFYASWGIVTLITTTLPTDIPAIRGALLIGSIEELKAENNNSGSPLFGKMSGRYGTSGYSMGGGGTTFASNEDPSLNTSVGLAAWGPSLGMTVPTLFLCGTTDVVAGCANPSTGLGTPNMQVSISGYGHMNWFGPTDISGYYALSWQKVYLEGDERWIPALSEQIFGVSRIDANL